MPEKEINNEDRVSKWLHERDPFLIGAVAGAVLATSIVCVAIRSGVEVQTIPEIYLEFAKNISE